MNRLMKNRNYLLVGLAAIPPIFILFYIWKLGVNIPYWDHWAMTDLFIKQDSGNLSLMDFWASNGEHRVFFPKVLFFIFAMLTGWNVKLGLLLNFIFAVAGFVLIIKLTKHLFNSRFTAYIVYILISIIYFSPIQWENWIWNFQVAWYMNILGLLACIYFIREKKDNTLYFAFACISALFASLSLGSGVYSWLIGIIMLVGYGWKKKYLFTWATFSIFFIAIYSYRLQQPQELSTKLTFIHYPVEFVKYFFMYLGRPLTYNPSLDIYAGVFLFGLFITLIISLLVYKKHLKNIKVLLPWIGLCIYALLSAVSTDLSRLYYGVTIPSRYVTISSLFLISIIILLSYYIETSDKKLIFKNMYIFLITLFVLYSVRNYMVGISEMASRSNHLKDIRSCVLVVQKDDDPCLDLVYPNRQYAWRAIEYTRAKSISVFSNKNIR